MPDLQPALLTFYRPVRLVLLLLAVLASGPVSAAGLTIESGAEMSLANGSMDLGCGDLVVGGILNLDSGALYNVDNVIINGGTLNGGSGSISLSGDWTNNGGSTNPGSSQVTINTDCGNDTVNVSGDSSFHDFTIQTVDGRQITFESGSTNSFSGHLVMNGLYPDDLLKIRASTPGSHASLLVNGTYAIDRVDVQDNHALLPGEWIDWGYPEDWQSIDRGGNFRWFRSGTKDGVLRFEVRKTFDDANAAGVRVHISCNTGVPLNNSAIVTADSFVTFVVTSIDATQAGPNCRIWEEDSAGYATTYSIDQCNPWTGACSVVNSGEEQGCFYEDVHPRESAELNRCMISNVLQPVRFTVNKEWLSTDYGSDVPLKARLEVNCSATALDYEDSWHWHVKGDESRTLDIYPRWQGDTTCTVNEDKLRVSSVEATGCDSTYAFEPGDADTSCTMINTIFFEGIPTLSKLGLALMTLLMLGLGLVGYRRII